MNESSPMDPQKAEAARTIRENTPPQTKDTSVNNIGHTKGPCARSRRNNPRSHVAASFTSRMPQLPEPPYKVSPIGSKHRSQTIASRSEDQRKSRSRKFDPLPLSYAEVYRILKEKGLVAPEPCRLDYRPSKPDPNARCEFHMEMVDNSIEHCSKFKHEVQDLTNTGQLRFMKCCPRM